jgi:hypothetical protein
MFNRVIAQCAIFPALFQMILYIFRHLKLKNGILHSRYSSQSLYVGHKLKTDPGAISFSTLRRQISVQTSLPKSAAKLIINLDSCTHIGLPVSSQWPQALLFIPNTIYRNLLPGTVSASYIVVKYFCWKDLDRDLVSQDVSSWPIPIISPYQDLSQQWLSYYGICIYECQQLSHLVKSLSKWFLTVSFCTGPIAISAAPKLEFQIHFPGRIRTQSQSILVSVTWCSFQPAPRPKWNHLPRTHKQLYRGANLKWVLTRGQGAVNKCHICRR